MNPVFMLTFRVENQLLLHLISIDEYLSIQWGLREEDRDSIL
jgi:hypothetical protein